MLSSGACLQHDNERPHAPRHTVKQNHVLQLEVLPRPRNSPDLEPGAFSSFLTPKTSPRGRHFESEDEVKLTVRDCLAQQPN